MAKQLFFFVACCAFMVGTSSVHAQQPTELVVVGMPNHGVVRILPEHRGLVYVGTGDSPDSFCFGTVDDRGVGCVDVTFDPVSECVSIDCEDWGGPTVTEFRLTALGGNGGANADAAPSADGTRAPSARRGYMLIIFVDQPGDGGDRDTWEGPWYHPSVGHAFVQLVNGETGVSRTFGFYGTDPLITPLNPASPGEIRDDSTHSWDVKLEIDISEEQYLELLEEIVDDTISPPEYNLNDNNCVDWVLDLLQEIGLTINTSVGQWPFGSGHDPGDFGQDLIGQGGERH